MNKTHVIVGSAKLPKRLYKVFTPDGEEVFEGPVTRSEVLTYLLDTDVRDVVKDMMRDNGLAWERETARELAEEAAKDIGFEILEVLV